MEYKPKLIDVEQISEGWVNKYVLTYERADGTPYRYECASRKKLEAFSEGLKRRGLAGATDHEAAGPDAVCIVPRTPRDTLVLIREFRYPLNSWCIAFPAGLVDPGEDVIACACRELAEETGYAVVEGTAPRALPQPGFSSTGLTDETVQIVFVDAEKREKAHTEPNELIEVFELPIASVRDFLDSNQTPIGTRAQLILELYATAR